MNNTLKLKKYFEEKLFLIKDLQKYLTKSAIVSVELDEKLIFDLIVFVPDQIFNNEFITQFGDCFVVNDQEQLPHVFTRFKSYQWLLNDFSRRLPIALWIFKQSIIIQDPEENFDKIVRKHSNLFKQNREKIIRQKYIEFRSDRHNIRQAIFHQNKLAINILRANVVKIALEIFILAHGEPYPYKKWLSSEAMNFDKKIGIINTCIEFVQETNNKKIITISDELVNKIANILKTNSNLSSKFINEWWLHLS